MKFYHVILFLYEGVVSTNKYQVPITQMDSEK